jgi:Transposase-associated domain
MSSYDHSWMYKRVINNEANPEFATRIHNFIAFAIANSPYPDEDKIKCPCKDCANRCYLRTVVVMTHLVSKGFTASYEK